MYLTEELKACAHPVQCIDTLTKITNNQIRTNNKQPVAHYAATAFYVYHHYCNSINNFTGREFAQLRTYQDSTLFGMVASQNPKFPFKIAFIYDLFLYSNEILVHMCRVDGVCRVRPSQSMFSCRWRVVSYTRLMIDHA